MARGSEDKAQLPRRGWKRRKQQSRWYWRHVTCDGCSKQCRYLDFKIFPGLKPAAVFKKVHELLKENKDDSSEWKYKRRGTITGILHRMKLEAWEHETQACREFMNAGYAPETDRADASGCDPGAFDPGQYESEDGAYASELHELGDMPPLLSVAGAGLLR